MTKLILSLLLTGFLLLCFSQNKQDSDPAIQIKNYQKAEKIFQQAENLSSGAGENEKLQAAADEVYARALISFKKIIAAAEKTGNDSICFFAGLKAGFMEFYFDSLHAAKKDYLATIALKQRLPSVRDSFLFIPFLYTGAIYYTQNEFDSALFFYKKAEIINDQYKKPLIGSERLYNRLGVMYYENGNYQKARNYFEKAITITSPSDTSLLINYKINIASLLVKLEEFPKAQSVYESLSSNNVYTDEINHNLGIISLKLKDYKKAISYLRKVNYSSNKKSIDLYYNFGVAWSGLHEDDSSEFYIQRAIAENTKWNGRKKNVPYGLILNFRAGGLVEQHKYNQAIEMYQQAIMQYDAGFNEEAIFKNPEEFSGVFSYINLFNTLVAKADALELLYQELKDVKFLEFSLAAYRSAFNLADYVEKTYDSDEARLFLGKIKYTAHSKPIDVCLLLYELTQEKKYLEDAFHFDQQNKASILSLNVQENELKGNNTAYKGLFEKETSLKSAITRLSIKSSKLIDSLEIQSIDSSIRDYEIQLGKLQEKINDDPAYHSGYFTSHIPGIHELQKKLDNTTALLSWHLSENDIVVFIITGNRFSYVKSSLNTDFLKNIDSFKVSLYNTSSEQRYSGAAVSSALYKSLMAPLEPKLSNIERLIIIPDDELNYLPFEALADEKGRYLIEKFSIQYQYSTALLGKDDNTMKAKGTLAFAPFASQGYSDSFGTRLSVLPASKEETSNLQGKIFTDSSALKNNFLSSANHYGIIHLATHASVDNEMPLRSFIAFYPVSGSNPDDCKLYAQEIYNLKLDSTQLVILSACETGAGKLVKGEGLMSLSRAFAYAGCPNIITSLWKAEDKTTAFITQKLHYYLDKGYSKDKALQQAKLDLLKSDEIDPRFKTPNYWAHLIFIGNYEPKHNSFNWWWIAIVIILAAIFYIATKRKA
jgi:CHAT domain-containing protein/tetratricopeptide (TPR) repeat protein